MPPLNPKQKGFIENVLETIGLSNPRPAEAFKNEAEGILAELNALPKRNSYRVYLEARLNEARDLSATDLRGMGRPRAIALGLGLFSLGGIPPTPGFWAKLAVLVVAWGYAGPLPTLIAVAGGVFSVLYYLRPVPELLAALRGEGALVPARSIVVPGVIVATLGVVGLGIFPGVIWTLAHAG